MPSASASSTQPPPQQQQEKSLLSKLLDQLPDPDSVLAYDTVKEVRVLDRRLGFLYYACMAVIATYVVVVVFLIKKQYRDNEKTSGWLSCKVMQPQLSHLNIPWDVYDRVTNPGEVGAVFIPTRVLVTKGQTQGSFCESATRNCTTNRDCESAKNIPSNGCAASGRCLLKQWCPAEDPAAATTETHYLDIDEVELWFQTYVRFQRFLLDVSTTDEKEPIYYPQKRANTYPLKEIVRMAGLNLEEFAENGATMLANSVFQCDLDSRRCDMKLEVNNIDTYVGFNHVHNHVYWEDGVEKRDSYHMYGIRLLTSATGFGNKVSFSQTMTQLSSAISLLTLAESIADVYLTTVVPERKHYAEKKMLRTEDFND
eukprot:TRINITY_DN30168_c0_g1_i1.p1 TRINITY_DN30168_c0_g1~~TRINITY_DN30168_c0_g1_i1.p1  ORF type:complete len:369 (-),score=91.51 TRINITY_DN30168_c0_g1_i1:49-1155(-)